MECCSASLREYSLCCDERARKCKRGKGAVRQLADRRAKYTHVNTPEMKTTTEASARQWTLLLYSYPAIDRESSPAFSSPPTHELHRTVVPSHLIASTRPFTTTAQTVCSLAVCYFQQRRALSLYVSTSLSANILYWETEVLLCEKRKCIVFGGLREGAHCWGACAEACL